MKRLALIGLLFGVALSISCQTQYASPQTVEWDEPEGVTDGYYNLVSYNVEVIHSFDDKEIESNYLPIVSGITLDEVFVSLSAAGYQGVFVVVISANLTRVSDSVAVTGERAYSDNADDIDTETFYIVLEPGMKVRRIRVR